MITLRNLYRCVELAGIAIEGTAEPLANAEVALTRDEKELGVVMLDIGGGTTETAAQQGHLENIAVLPVGRPNNDIAVGLRTTFSGKLSWSMVLLP